MPQGRRPKPTETKKRQGNPGRRPLPKNEPVYTGTTTPPLWLDHVGRVEWKRLRPRLEVKGMLTPEHRAAFAGYCSAYSRLAKAEHFLNSKEAAGSLMYKNDAGVIKAWPQVAIATSAADQMRKFLIEFGLTPASAGKVTSTESDPKEKAAAFLFGQEDTSPDEIEPGQVVEFRKK